MIAAQIRVGRVEFILAAFLSSSKWQLLFRAVFEDCRRADAACQVLFPAGRGRRLLTSAGFWRIIYLFNDKTVFLETPVGRTLNKLYPSG